MSVTIKLTRKIRLLQITRQFRLVWDIRNLLVTIFISDRLTPIPSELNRAGTPQGNMTP